MFKNILFKSEIMPGMHDSMVKLHGFVAEKLQLVGQSVVARKMNETPQVVKNWEGRGISEGGALNAQRLFGCDANWLLGKVKNPTVFTTGHCDSAASIPAESSGGWMWPFRSVGPAAYNALSVEEKEHLEMGILLAVKNRGHPQKNVTPAGKIARG